jgi:hypothetical protein
VLANQYADRTVWQNSPQDATERRRKMKARRVLISVVLVGLALAGSVGISLGQDAPSIGWWVIGGGGGSASSDGMNLDGTIGQWAVGSNTSDNTQLDSGFWAGVLVLAAIATPTPTITATPGPSPTPTVEYKIFLPLILREG